MGDRVLSRYDQGSAMFGLPGWLEECQGVRRFGDHSWQAVPMARHCASGQVFRRHLMQQVSTGIILADAVRG
jgi:hypothetical protein